MRWEGESEARVSDWNAKEKRNLGVGKKKAMSGGEN